MTTTTATDKQIAFYGQLLARIGFEGELAAEMSATFATKSKAEASALIDGAIEIARKAAAESPAAKSTMTPARQGKVEGVQGVHPGIYTVESEAGRRTFKVEIQASDASFAPGKTILSFLSGQDNTSDYTGFAFLTGTTVRPWKRFADSTELLGFAHQLVADPEAALVAKHCARCARVLTTPESIRQGLGPECVKMGLR